MKFKEEIDRLYYEALELNDSIIRNKLQLIAKNIKDRKKSLAAKNFWRRNAYKMKKAIQKWHQSTQGKRFHRNLGNFLATHLTKSDLGLLKKEEYPNKEIEISLDDIASILLGLNNIKTHLIIEMQYFEKDSEALEEFLEIFFKFLEDSYEIEIELLKAYINGTINEEILFRIIDIFIYFIDENQFLYEVRQINGLSNDKNVDKTVVEELNELKNINTKQDKIFFIINKYNKNINKNKGQ